MELKIVPNREAAAYVEGKAAVYPETFRDLPEELRGRAFTVARVADFDVLRDLMERIAELPQGGDWRAISKGLAAEISPYMDDSEDGEAAARAKAELLLRTHGFQAYAAGRYRQQRATADALPYWQYLTAGDGKVRPEHEALDGMILPADDPFWDTHYPPWDFGCRCLVAALTVDEAEAAGVGSGAGADEALREAVETMTPEEREASAAGRAYSWRPGEIALDAEMFRERYGALYGLFAEEMKKRTVDVRGRRMSVWEWMGGKEQ